MRQVMTKELGLIPIPLLILLMAIAAITFRSPFVFEPPLLALSLSLFFRFGISMVVAYFAARSYFVDGSLNLLLLGCAAFAFALTAITGSWFGLVFGDTNALLLLNNTGALISAGLNLASAIVTFKVAPVQPPRNSRARLLAAHLGAATVTGLLLGLRNFLPPFFMHGSTMLNVTVLGLAVVLFALASVLFMRFYLESRSGIIWWYSLGLGLIAISQASFFVSKVPGDLISWAGRLATCLGTTYLLILVLGAKRTMME